MAAKTVRMDSNKKENLEKEVEQIKHYDPFETLDFRFDRCMVTGEALKNREQIVQLFPDWLLDKYDLNSKRITLQTGDQIEYQHVMIPLCEDGLDGFNALQRAIKIDMDKGHDGLKWLEPDLLYLWLQLLFYGVLYYEYSLAIKSSKIRGTFLADAGNINRFRIIHIGLNALLNKVEYKNFDPCSIIAFQIMEDEKHSAFDLNLGFNTLTMAIRFGDLGIICALLDNGIQKNSFASYLDKFSYLKMHPLQFDELYAKVSYKSYLTNLVHEYGLSYTEDASLEIGMRIPEELKDTPVFMEWKDDLYLEVLLAYLSKYGFTKDKLVDKNKKPLTFLLNEKEEPIDMSKN